MPIVTVAPRRAMMAADAELGSTCSTGTPRRLPAAVEEQPGTVSAERDATRFEVEFSLSLAAVPAWAPIGVDSDDYRVHLHGDGRAAPLPETLLHHQERWGHVARYDDFVDLLRLDGFDAAELAGLAFEAGAGRVFTTARSADGWCWWDASEERSVARRGPRRDIVRELTEATHARGLVAGVRYHGVGATDPARHAAELLARYGIEAISGDWEPALDARLRDALDGERSEVLVDVDHAPSGVTGWRTRSDGQPANGRPAGHWLWTVPTGSGFGSNHADPAGRRLLAEELVLRYAETVQDDGSMRVVTPLSSDGLPHVDDARTLRAAGSWIRGFGPLLDGATGCHHRVGGIALFEADDHLLAVVPADRRLVPGLTVDVARITRVVELEPQVDVVTPAPAAVDVMFEQDADGLHLHAPIALSTARPAPDAARMPRVLRLEVATVEPPVQLFAAEEPADLPLAPLLDDRGPGEIVQLGDRHYVGPATVPSGVTVRGLGADRTLLTGVVTLDRGARLEHLAADDVAIPAGSSDAMLLGCTLRSVMVRGGRTTIRASRAGTIAVAGADHTTISRCRLAGERARGSVAISVRAGRDVEIDGCSVEAFETAIDVTESEGVAVRGCTFRHVGTAVHLTAGERAHVCASRIERVTRAIDVAGGLSTLIDGNVVIDADSGVVVRDGAAGCIVSGNYWERCRIGALLWDVDDVRVGENVVEDLSEPEHEVQRGP